MMMARSFRPSISSSIVAAAAALLASSSGNVVADAASSSSTTYTAELYLDLDPSGVENYLGYDFLGLGTTPSGFVPALDRLFFMASHSSSGTELYDGDAAMVKDIQTNLIDGEVGSALSIFGETTTAVAGGRLFFFADDGVNGMELWTTDGTEENTSMVKDINTGAYSAIDTALYSTSGIPQIVAFQERVYFPARYNFDRSTGLYVSDGTEEGTQLVQEGVNSPLPSSAVVSYIIEYDGRAYFPADGEVCHSPNGVVSYCQPGKALYVIEDGMLKLTAPLVTGNVKKTMFVHKDALYFLTTTGLVRTDGTRGGTVSLPRGVGNHYTSMEDALYFTCYDSIAQVNSICRTDGTAEGTLIVANVSSPVGLSKGLTPLGDKILFHNRKRKYGAIKPHVLDTVSGKVSTLADLETSDVHSYFFIYDNHAFFKAKEIVDSDANATGLELWVTDGTPGGTVLVKDIRPGVLGSDIQGFGIFRETLYFNAQNVETGNELWRVVKCPDGVCPTPATTQTLTANPTVSPEKAPVPSPTDAGPVTVTQSTALAATAPDADPDPTRSPAGKTNVTEDDIPTFSPTGSPSFSPTYAPVSNVSASSLNDPDSSASAMSGFRFFVRAILFSLAVGMIIF